MVLEGSSVILYVGKWKLIFKLFDFEYYYGEWGRWGNKLLCGL